MSQGGTDDDRRAWTKRVAGDFAFAFPSEAWGTQRASASRPMSTDVMSTNPPHVGFDIVLAGGADAQRVDFTPDPLDLSDHLSVPVTPKDHVGSGGGPPPPERMRLGASLLWGLGGERHGWPELDQQLREYQAAEVDFVRTLIHLRTRGDDEGNPWFHIGVHAEDADLESLIARYSDRVKRFGMRVEWTLLGGMGDMSHESQQDRFVDRVSIGLKPRLSDVELIEVMNEYKTNGGSIPVLHRMAKRLRANLGNSFLLSLSSPSTVQEGASTTEIQAEVRAMQLHEANAITPHWNRRNHVAPDLGSFSPGVEISNEPRGPSSSVGETDDPAVIEQDWKAAEAAGYYAYVLHSDSGVWSTKLTGRYKDTTRGQWPVFSSHRNGPAILATVARLRGAVGGIHTAAGGCVRRVPIQFDAHASALHAPDRRAQGARDRLV